VKNLRYRLGIDLGTTSIGTALVELTEANDLLVPSSVMHMGVRIFEDGRDPKTKEPLGVTRRNAKQARKNRDRYLRRRKRLMDALIEFGLMPKQEDQRKCLALLNPYDLRMRGLDEQISLSELARAIFHLNQRRGFKSNRKAQGGEDGKIRVAVNALKEIFQKENCRTLGEFYYKTRLQKGLSVRSRLEGNGAKAAYPFYPSREMLEDEFNKLWDTQAQFYSKVLTHEAKEKIRDIFLYQRPLKPVKPGRCTLEPGELRAPLASPLFQKFRILQQINELRILDHYGNKRSLTREQRDLLYKELSHKKELKCTDARNKILKLARNERFSIEDDRKDKLSGDQIAALLGAKKYFGENWFKLPLENQCEIVNAIRNEENSEKLIDILMAFGVSHEIGASICEENMPTGYGNLSEKVLKKIIPELEAEVITYAEAAKRAGYNHSSNYTGEIFDKLPYYGKILENRVAHGSGLETDSDEKRYGKIANPTVHIALNQLRHVVNCVIKHFGAPEQIVIEVARDLKMSIEETKDYTKRQKENQDNNERINKELEKLGQVPNGANRERYKLWENLGDNPMDRRCPYTQQIISVNMIFSAEVEVEHILPFGQTYDDSLANKTLSMRYANRAKGNKSPFEAFGNSPTIAGVTYDYQVMMDSLPKSEFWTRNRWRFEKDALDRFNENGDFQNRQLTDTAYASRLALEYLQYICPPPNIWAIPGRLTSMMRSKWGLNEILGIEQEDGTFKKSRDHHGHHAIDALVVAMTDRSLLQRISKMSGDHWINEKHLLKGFEPPITDLQLQARNRLQKLVVSHRKDHGAGGLLHNATAYGFVGEYDANGASQVRHRVFLTSLKKDAIVNVQSEAIKVRLEELAADCSTEKEWSDALLQFSQETGIRRVRIIEKISVIPIANRETGAVYKAFKTDGNYCYDIWADGDKWTGRVISRYEANVNGAKTPENVLMRLRGGDTICLENMDFCFFYVVGISLGKVTLAPIFESGNLRERDRSKIDSFKYLVKSPNALLPLKARVVHVDECGFVYDPGFMEK